MDFQIVLEKVLPSLLSSALGGLGAVWKFTHGLSARVAAVENAIETVKLAVASTGVTVGENKREGNEKLEELRRLLTLIKKDMDEEFETIYNTFKTRSKEQTDIRRLNAKLTERYIGLEARLEAAEKSITVMNNSLKEFMQEQQGQWKETAKTLGHIEGYLRARRGSGPSFPPVK